MENSAEDSPQLTAMDTLLYLFVKIVIVATTIVAASVAAERSGPIIGGLIIALPVSAGPGYVFLARQASDAFISRSALYSFGVTAVTAIYLAIYIRLAPRLNAVATVVIGLAAWCVLASLLQLFELDWRGALVLNVASFGACLALTRDRASATLPTARATKLQDLLARALLAGSLVAAVVTVSDVIGPRLTGSTVTFPVTLTTLGLIMHWRYGGAVAARAMRGAMAAMPCFCACILSLHLLAEPLGAPRALLAALGVSLAASALFLAGDRLVLRRRAVLAAAANRHHP
jgi:hypothetical protein